MEKIIYIEETKDYLYLPVKADGKETLIEIYYRGQDKDDTKILEFMVPLGDNNGEIYRYDYLAAVLVKEFTKQTIIIKGDVSESYMNEVKNNHLIEYEPIERPFIHFTAQRGWINDPNGLIYKDGIYHLYFQYNPFNTSWNNMCWGHATSEDLLRWTQKDTVLFPDEEGMMFSGCAVANDRGLLQLPKDSILFFYTAAGGTNEWGRDKLFTQRLAFSLDGGNTLKKIVSGKIDTIKKENRDPKVFWHENSNAYIMCLWLEDNEFAILRSKDLEEFELSHSFTLDKAWECPDLMLVPAKNGKEQWVFWSADGFYYFGEFDGYEFITDGKRHKAYINNLPYAAQTYQGTGKRIISVSWIRSLHHGRLYTGAMGLPRELSVIEIKGKQYISQQLTKEFHQAKKKTESLFSKDRYITEISCATEIVMELKEELSEAVEWNVCGTVVVYDSNMGTLTVGKIKDQEDTYEIGANIKDFSFVMDDTLLEVTANHGIIVGVFELSRLDSKINAKSDDFNLWESYVIE